MESSQIIILAIIVTSLATFISRFMGALTSEKVSVKSKVFSWFNCVAYSTLAALLGRMIIFPAGVLADSELITRLIVLIICISIFIFTKKNLVLPTIFSALFLGFLTNF
jgi:branched-subunit amino acid transport protein